MAVAISPMTDLIVLGVLLLGLADIHAAIRTWATTPHDTPGRPRSPLALLLAGLAWCGGALLVGVATITGY